MAFVSIRKTLKIHRSAMIGFSLRIDARYCHQQIGKELRQTLWLGSPMSQPLELFDRYDHHGYFVLACDDLCSAFARPLKCSLNYALAVCSCRR